MLKRIEDMTYSEMAIEIAKLRLENQHLKKYKHNSEREVFKKLPQEQKKELFGYKGNSDTGKIEPTENLDIMNNNFKKLYAGILKTIFPRMRAFKSTKGKYSLHYTTFNDMSEEQYSEVEEMIVSICDIMYEYKKSSLEDNDAERNK